MSGSRSDGAELSAEDFEAIEAAVMETRKGRWFLGEYATRHRTADTLMLLEMMKKLEGAVSRTQGDGELAALAATIGATRADIAAVRNDMIDGGGALENSLLLYGEIGKSAANAAGELMSRSQTLNAVAQALKARTADEAPAVETDALGLQTLAWHQDIMSQRLAKAMGLLAYLDERIATLSEPAAASAPPQIPRLTPTNLGFFKQDEDIFATEPAPPPPQLFAVKTEDAPPAPPPAIAAQTDAEPKRRVVIIRRTSPGEVAIPLASEAQASAAH